MRKNEFKVENKEVIKKLLDECEYGTLSLISEGKPYGVAVNFVYFNERIFIHGAKEGKKVQAIHSTPYASFLVVKSFSLIPSHFSDTLAACPATQYFSSVHCEGAIKELKIQEAKAIVLNKLMEKLQTDGGYEPIAYDNPIYTKMIANTAVFELSIEQISCKVKAGQNLSHEKKQTMMQKLNDRATPLDIDTVNLMKSMDE